MEETIICSSFIHLFIHILVIPIKHLKMGQYIVKGRDGSVASENNQRWPLGGYNALLMT